MFERVFRALIPSSAPVARGEGAWGEPPATPGGRLASSPPFAPAREWFGTFGQIPPA